MAIAIYTGVCKGGPWDGDEHQQITRPRVNAGYFNLTVGTQRGSYTFFVMPGRGEWRWGPWIEERTVA